MTCLVLRGRWSCSAAFRPTQLPPKIPYRTVPHLGSPWQSRELILRPLRSGSRHAPPRLACSLVPAIGSRTRPGKSEALARWPNSAPRANASASSPYGAGAKCYHFEMQVTRLHINSCLGRVCARRRYCQHGRMPVCPVSVAAPDASNELQAPRCGLLIIHAH